MKDIQKKYKFSGISGTSIDQKTYLLKAMSWR